MNLRVMLLMDPIAGINIRKDTSFLLGLEAQARGCELLYTKPDTLQWHDGALLARVHPLQLRNVIGDHFTLGEAVLMPLAEMHVILMRQDPPFDMGYITITHWLETLPPSVRVLNNPRSVRNAPEKLWVTQFPEMIPPTLITRDAAAIEAFRADHHDIIIKPLYGAGGAGVFRFTPENENLGSYLEMMASRRETLVVQRYIPAVRHGDKRIILIDGKAVGAVLRVPQRGDARANFHAGGTAAKAVITEREHAFCTTLKPYLQAQGLFLVGLDVIGDYVTEINVTSPTGFHEINALDGVCLEAIFWDAVIAGHRNA